MVILYSIGRVGTIQILCNHVREGEGVLKEYKGLHEGGYQKIIDYVSNFNIIKEIIMGRKCNIYLIRIAFFLNFKSI